MLPVRVAHGKDRAVHLSTRVLKASLAALITRWVRRTGSFHKTRQRQALHNKGFHHSRQDGGKPYAAKMENGREPLWPGSSLLPRGAPL